MRLSDYQFGGDEDEWSWFGASPDEITYSDLSNTGHLGNKGLPDERKHSESSNTGHLGNKSKSLPDELKPEQITMLPEPEPEPKPEPKPEPETTNIDFTTCFIGYFNNVNSEINLGLERQFLINVSSDLLGFGFINISLDGNNLGENTNSSSKDILNGYSTYSSEYNNLKLNEFSFKSSYCNDDGLIELGNFRFISSVYNTACTYSDFAVTNELKRCGTYSGSLDFTEYPSFNDVPLSVATSYTLNQNFTIAGGFSSFDSERGFFQSDTSDLYGFQLSYNSCGCNCCDLGASLSFAETIDSTSINSSKHLGFNLYYNYDGEYSPTINFGFETKEQEGYSIMFGINWEEVGWGVLSTGFYYDTFNNKFNGEIGYLLNPSDQIIIALGLFYSTRNISELEINEKGTHFVFKFAFLF